MIHNWCSKPDDEMLPEHVGSRCPGPENLLSVSAGSSSPPTLKTLVWTRGDGGLPLTSDPWQETHGQLDTQVRQRWMASGCPRGLRSLTLSLFLWWHQGNPTLWISVTKKPRHIIKVQRLESHLFWFPAEVSKLWGVLPRYNNSTGTMLIWLPTNSQQLEQQRWLWHTVHGGDLGTLKHLVPDCSYLRQKLHSFWESLLRTNLNIQTTKHK